MADLKNIDSITDSLGNPLNIGFRTSVFHVRDQRAYTEGYGSTPTIDVWNTRILQTIHTNTMTGASLAANQITLPAGTYNIVANAPVYRTDRHQLRLRNITDSTTALVGGSQWSNTTDGSNNALMQGQIIITSTKVFELQHYLESAGGGTIAFGIDKNADADAEVEVYADIRITSEGSVAPSSKVIGPWLELDRQTVAGVTEIDFIFDPALYDDYELIVNDLFLQNDTANPAFRISLDSGATFEAGASDYGQTQWIVNDADATNSAGGAATKTEINISGNVGNAATEKVDSTIWFRALDSVNHKFFKIESTYLDATSIFNSVSLSGRYAGTGVVNGIRIFELGGDTLTGTATLRARLKAGTDFFHTDPIGQQVGAPFLGAMVYLAAADTDDYTTPKAVDWTAKEYDIGGWHNSTLDERLTVPAGVSRVRVHANLYINGIVTTSEFTQVEILKNASSSYNGYASQRAELNDADHFNQCSTGVVDVVEGDYFTCVFRTETDASVNIQNANSNFSIEAVEAISPSAKVLGPWLELDEQIVSGVANVEFTFNPLLYDEIELKIIEAAPASDNQGLQLYTSSDGGVTFDVGGSDYSYISTKITVDAVETVTRIGDDLATAMVVMTALGNVAGENYSTTIRYLNPGGTTIQKFSWDEGFGRLQDGVEYVSWGGGSRLSATAVNAVRIQVASGNISGTFSLRGRPKAGVDFFHSQPEIFKVGLPFSGAMAILTGDDTGDYSPVKVIDWDTTSYDIDNWWSVGNPGRLTVPTGVSKVRVSATLHDTGSVSGEFELLDIWKNGATFHGNGAIRSEISLGGSILIGVTTSVLEVVAGDYFEAQVTVETDSSVNFVSGRCAFSIEAVEGIAPKNTPRGALVHLAADEVDADYTTATAIPFDAEAYDTDTIHDTVTNNTRLTVPSGVSHVRLTGQATMTSTTAETWANLAIRKNGAIDYLGSTNDYHGDITRTDSGIGTTGPVLEVVPGDYFELFLRYETDITITLDDDRTWFNMEIVEPVVLGDGGPLDISLFLPGVQSLTSQLLMQYIFVRNGQFPSGLTGSIGFSGTAALAQTILDIQKNDVSIGSITWAISGTVPTFTMADTANFVAGDRLNIIAPTTADADLADFSVTLKGERR